MKQTATAGILLALIATLIWSGNFIIARAIYADIPPITLSLFRWATASLILLPFSIQKTKTVWPIIRSNGGYFFWTSLTGIALFNTFVYVAGHYTTATNMALIGTTSSPIFAMLMAAVFLKEALSWQRILGVLLCISGILLLITKASWYILLHIHFSIGDVWILLAGLSFAIYNLLVRRKPAGISPIVFLFTIFSLGTLLLLPFSLLELQQGGIVISSWKLWGMIAYLGLGTSVISFLCWNAAIERLGAVRTALFGNLIPIFSSIEALILLKESFTWLHATSAALVLMGLFIANNFFKVKRA